MADFLSLSPHLTYEKALIPQNVGAGNHACILSLWLPENERFGRRTLGSGRGQTVDFRIKAVPMVQRFRVHDRDCPDRENLFDLSSRAKRHARKWGAAST